MASIRLAVLSSLLLPVALAHAENADEPAEGTITARAPANEDSFTPGLTHASAVGRAIATATATLDGAQHRNTVDLNGEVQVFGPVRLVLRVDNVLAGGDGKARPGIGAAVQLLDERKHGVAGSAYVSYKAEGFTEAEGEIESLVSFGKQLGPVHGTLNLAYGQDFDNVERDGELALGLHIEPVHGLFTGVVGRFRDALGSNGDKGVLLNGGQIVRDALGGASATYVIGNVGLTATAGIAGVETTTSRTMQAGPAAAFTIGTVF